jgi:hypothetical protein
MNWFTKLKNKLINVPKVETPIVIPTYGDGGDIDIAIPTGEVDTSENWPRYVSVETLVPTEQLPDYQVKYNNFVNKWNSLERLEREKEEERNEFLEGERRLHPESLSEYEYVTNIVLDRKQKRQAELSKAHNEYMKAKAEAEGVEIPYDLSKLDTTPKSFVVEPEVRRGRIYAPRKKKEVVVDPMLELFKEIRNEHPEDHITAEIQRLKRVLHSRGLPKAKQITIAIRYTKWVNSL